MARKLARVLLFLVIPGALVAGVLYVAGIYAAMMVATKTDDPYLEELRPRVVLYVAWRFGLRASVAVARAMLGILDRENKGRIGDPIVGDQNLAGGPSIGPGQVYRATAIALNFVPADITPAEYAALAGNRPLMLDWSVRVFRAKVQAANGDLGQAIQLYNGSGPAAVAYRDEVVAFLTQTFGTDPLGPRAPGGAA